MNNKTDNVRNLLLNLLVRETCNWYFFDTLPRYDPALSAYMQATVQRGFLRFDLPSFHAVIYFPLAYRSLTGMHIFGDTPALRDTLSQSIIMLDCDKAIYLLLAESFPSFSEEHLHELLEDLTAKYDRSMSNSLEKLVPEGYIHPLQGQQFPNAQNAKYDIDVQALFNEYGDSISSLKLLEAITLYAGSGARRANIAAQDWVKQYSTLLLAAALSNYVTRGKIGSLSLYHTKIGLDHQGFPRTLSFKEDCPALLCRQLPPAFNKRKLEQCLLCQLLNQHLFPLVRAIGLLGLVAEEDALAAVSDVLDGFRKQFVRELYFFEDLHTRVPAFLCELLGVDAECEHMETHVHNHTLNKAYYAHELIKPAPSEVVHKRYFNGGTYEIAIRGFDIKKDLEVVHEWVNLDYAKKFWEMDGPIHRLEEHYIKYMGVDYAHPYIGTLNGEPIFTLELYWAIKDEVGKYAPFHPGDYGFHMLIAPAKQRIPHFSFHALTMCMEHFFSFSQVHRMIGEASADHMGTHNLITKVGCAFDQALVLPYKTSNLTFLTRPMYREAVKEVLENSCTEIMVNI